MSGNVMFAFAALCVVSMLSIYVSHVDMRRFGVGQQQQQEVENGGVFYPAGMVRNKFGRTLVGYTSSPWEQHWFRHVDEYAERRSICARLQKDPWQRDMLRRHLRALCTTFPLNDSTSPWCLQDDAYRPLYFNHLTGETTDTPPPDVTFEATPRPILPTDEDDDIFSYFTYRDNRSGRVFREYIEPLVSHLRHPLARCKNTTRHLMLHRGFIVPPPPSEMVGKAFYFDAGASNFTSGLGGPSLSVLTELWHRHGIEFDAIHAFEGTTSPASFYRSVPDRYRSRITFQQAWVRNAMIDPTNPAGPFLPEFIQSHVTPSTDYILFKLDIDSPAVEQGQVDHLLSSTDGLDYVDEFIWEHHIAGNYLMRQAWQFPKNIDCQKEHCETLSQSYSYFMELRKRGIRAHSWV